MIVGPADVKMKRKRIPCFIEIQKKAVQCALTDLDSDVRLKPGKLDLALLCKGKFCGTNSGNDKEINNIRVPGAVPGGKFSSRITRLSMSILLNYEKIHLQDDRLQTAVHI